MKVNTDALTLKLHVAGNKVWQSLGTELPRATDMTVAEFIAAGKHTRADSIRIIGAFQNASLIVQAYGHVQVELVSPLVCPTSADRKDPAKALYYMRKSMLAPSQGGFHVMTDAEQLVYGIAAVLQQQGTASIENGQIVQLAQRHPVWPAMKFISNLSEPSAATLLGIVLDPRWYIDTAYPDRGAKLFTYLGLQPKTQAGVTLGAAPWRRHAYCEMVRSIWYTPATAEAVLHTKWAMGKLVPGGENYGTMPGDFLWRVWADRMPPSMDHSAEVFDKAKVMADLRTSQRCVNYIRLLWLATLYSDSQRLPDGGQSLFRAEDFFKHVVEAAAFKYHILRS